MEYRIVRVERENYCRFADLLYWREQGKERTPSREEGPEELLNPNLYVYALETEGRFVGWISLVYIPKVSRWKRGHVYVDELWVQPEYRRRGFGGALMEQADLLCKELGAVGKRLYVNVENPKAKGLYERRGFREAGMAYFMEG